MEVIVKTVLSAFTNSPIILKLVTSYNEDLLYIWPVSSFEASYLNFTHVDCVWIGKYPSRQPEGKLSGYIPNILLGILRQIWQEVMIEMIEIWIFTCMCIIVMSAAYYMFYSRRIVHSHLPR